MSPRTPRWSARLLVLVGIGLLPLAALGAQPETAPVPAPAVPVLDTLPAPVTPAQPVEPGVTEWFRDLALVPSVFEDDPEAGKDPFFPNSLRDRGGAKKTNAVSVVLLPDVELNGISVSATRRLIILNRRYTLAEGEEAELRVGDRTYRVRCVEVRETSAVISHNGQKRELFLPSNF